MGTIKRIRRKYQTPSHPWEKDRLPEEKEFKKEYGFKNKKEIWKTVSILNKFKALAKEYIAKNTKQAEKESKLLLERIRSIGLLGDTSMLADVLTLQDKDILERRLQTVLFRKGLARSTQQARQFIVHGHVKINRAKISSPSYIVRKAEEDAITFSESSVLADNEHPERVILQKKEKPARVERPDQKRRSLRGRGQVQRRHNQKEARRGKNGKN